MYQYIVLFYMYVDYVFFKIKYISVKLLRYLISKLL